MCDPLESIANVSLAVRDFALVIAEYAQQIADWVKRLRDALIDKFGFEYWIVLGLPPLWGNAAT